MNNHQDNRDDLGSIKKVSCDLCRNRQDLPPCGVKDNFLPCSDFSVGCYYYAVTGENNNKGLPKPSYVDRKRTIEFTPETIQRLDETSEIESLLLLTCPYDFRNNNKTDLIFKGEDSTLKRISLNDNYIHHSLEFKNIVFQGIAETDALGKNAIGCIEFCNVIFYGKINFSYCNFNAPVIFKRCVFFEDFEIISSHFEKSVAVLNCKFVKKFSIITANSNETGKIEKNDIKFITNKGDNSNNGRDNTSFREYVSFENSEFIGETTFYDINFEESVSFNSARFYEASGFLGCEFRQDSNFERTKYNRGVTFNGCFLGLSATFKMAHFSGTSYIRNMMDGKTRDSGQERDVGIIDFTNISSPPECFLDIYEAEWSFVKRLLFKSSDMNTLRLLSCKWHENGLILSERSIIKKEQENQTNLKTEKKKHKNDISTEYKDISFAYTLLKQNAAKEGNMHLVSIWHIKEKDAFVKSKDCTFFRKMLLQFYNLSSRYGEEPLRAFVVLAWIVTIMLGLAFYSDLKQFDNIIYVHLSNLFMVGLFLYPFWSNIQKKLKIEEIVFVRVTAYIAIINTVILVILRPPVLRVLNAFHFLPFKSYFDSQSYDYPNGVIVASLFVIFNLLIPLQLGIFLLALRNRVRR